MTREEDWEGTHSLTIRDREASQKLSIAMKNKGKNMAEIKSTNTTHLLLLHRLHQNPSSPPPSPPPPKRPRLSIRHFSSTTATPSLPALQHLSNIRTTSVKRKNAPARVFSATPMTSVADICLCVDAEIPPAPCEECVQECEEEDCAVALSSQCTNQCVVVPCNDAHHATDKNCDHPAIDVRQPCDIACSSGPDCTVLDEIVSNQIYLLVVVVSWD